MATIARDRDGCPSCQKLRQGTARRRLDADQGHERSRAAAEGWPDRSSGTLTQQTATTTQQPQAHRRQARHQHEGQGRMKRCAGRSWQRREMRARLAPADRQPTALRTATTADRRNDLAAERVAVTRGLIGSIASTASSGQLKPKRRWRRVPAPALSTWSSLRLLRTRAIGAVPVQTSATATATFGRNDRPRPT